MTTASPGFVVARVISRMPVMTSQASDTVAGAMSQPQTSEAKDANAS